MTDDNQPATPNWQRPHSMTRRVLTILLCLLAGAIINVLVAWGLSWNGSAFFIPEKTAGRAGPQPGSDSWYVSSSKAIGRSYCVSAWTDEGFSPERGVPYGEDPATLVPFWMSSAQPVNEGTGRHVRQGHAYGFPFVSLWWEQRAYGLPGTRTGIVPAGMRIDAGDVTLDPNSHSAQLGVVSVPRVLPVRPIWPNTLWNTLLYAAVLLIPVQCYFSIRDARRLKRGLCPGCAYDLRGSPSTNCPECGKPIGSARSAA